MSLSRAQLQRDATFYVRACGDPVWTDAIAEGAGVRGVRTAEPFVDESAAGAGVQVSLTLQIVPDSLGALAPDARVYRRVGPGTIETYAVLVPPTPVPPDEVLHFVQLARVRAAVGGGA